VVSDRIVGELLLLNRDVCRVAELASWARLEVVVKAPLLKDVRDCRFELLGNLLQSREALGVTLETRDNEAACRGSIVRVVKEKQLRSWKQPEGVDRPKESTNAHTMAV
jgi:3-polyprenyl-4-hydroxybenzoate decarboxylase